MLADLIASVSSRSFAGKAGASVATGFLVSAFRGQRINSWGDAAFYFLLAGPFITFVAYWGMLMIVDHTLPEGAGKTVDMGHMEAIFYATLIAIAALGWFAMYGSKY